jgi:DNA helicase-2/ATP-dependent DNA helicase PcrA
MAIDYKKFIESKKSLLIAPAGHGKTYTIAECVKYHTEGKQLILTHTHAGVASLKKKFNSKDFQIPSNSYSIETITGFIQKYILSFYPKNKIVDSTGKVIKENSPEYFKFIDNKALILFQKPLIQNILQRTYSGIFVDEYQDCSLKQHQIITNLSKNIPLRMLGDHLQGIFDFNDTPITLEELEADCDYICKLENPHRWQKEGATPELGEIIKNIRNSLDNNIEIQLDDNPNANFNVCLINDSDIFNPESEYRKKLNHIIRYDKDEYKSLLIIVPEYEKIVRGSPRKYGTINDRVKLRDKIDYTRSLILLEPIDQKQFYSIANKIDKVLTSRKKLKNLYDNILSKIFIESSLINIILDDFSDFKYNDIRKNQEVKDNLRAAFELFISNTSYKTILNLILLLKNEIKLKTKRDELFSSLVSCLKESLINNETVYQNMIKHRNKIRRMGRYVNQKCLGTTLLTKGLEFDTVIILDAHNFDCPKNFYVAISRCCKRLIIFTKNNILQFNR